MMFLGDFGRRRPARTGGCCCHLHMQIKPAANIITTAQVNLFIFGEMKLCTISSKKNFIFLYVTITVDFRQRSSRPFPFQHVHKCYVLCRQ